MAALRSAGLAFSLCGLAVLVITAITLQWNDGSTTALAQSGDPAVRTALVAKLKRLLLSEKDTYDHTTKILHTRASHRTHAQRKWSQAELDQAACDDGEPCKVNQMPILKYIPSTGNWDVISAGNPDAIWHKLMSQARQRDKTQVQTYPDEQGESVEFTRQAKDKSFSQSLLQVSDDHESEEHKRLEARLKSLLEARLAKGRSLVRHMARPEQFGNSATQQVDSPNDSPESRRAYKLKSNLRDAEVLASSGHDTHRMEHLINALGNTGDLRDLCTHPALSHNVLGVYKASSLSACVRQLRIRMEDSRQALRSRLERVKYTGSSSENARFGSKAGYSELDSRKQSLTTELNVLKKSHDQVRKRRIFRVPINIHC
jgi:hypothetical protein